MSTMNNTVWHPIKGHEGFTMNRHGKIKNPQGRIIGINSRRNQAHIAIQLNKQVTTLNVTEVHQEIFEKKEITNDEFATFHKYSFYNCLSPKNRGNYSEDELLFELEIKGKRVS